MITVFNREMLYMTYDNRSYKNACDVLNEYNIDYKVKVKYASHGRKSNVGKTSIEYKIFVSKKDYNSAKGAISKHRDEITTITDIKRRIFMITFFNRQEVLLTEYADVYHNALDILQQAGIKCHSRIKGNMSGKRLNGSTKSGRTARHMNTYYYIYVHKNDRQKAKGETAKHYKEIYNK